MKRRTAVISIIAALSLGAAGISAAHGRDPGTSGKPSVTPPPWSHGHGDGNGDNHGQGGGKSGGANGGSGSTGANGGGGHGHGG